MLVVPGCPNATGAHALAREAARQAGIADVVTKVTVVGTDQAARRRGFAGSPTFLVDGIDPFAVPATATGLTCRVYSTATGLAGLPELAELRAALVRADAARASEEDDRGTGRGASHAGLPPCAASETGPGPGRLGRYGTDPRSPGPTC